MCAGIAEKSFRRIPFQLTCAFGELLRAFRSESSQGLRNMRGNPFEAPEENTMTNRCIWEKCNNCGLSVN